MKQEIGPVLELLLDRVRAASGPDHELDRDITAAFAGGIVEDVLDYAVGASVPRVTVPIPSEFGVGRRCVSYGHLTGSLDAAIRFAERDGIIEEIGKHPWPDRMTWAARFRFKPSDGTDFGLSGRECVTRPLAVLEVYLDAQLTRLRLRTEALT